MCRARLTQAGLLIRLEHVDLSGNPVQRLPLLIQRLETKVRSLQAGQLVGSSPLQYFGISLHSICYVISHESGLLIHPGPRLLFLELSCASISRVSCFARELGEDCLFEERFTYGVP